MLAKTNKYYFEHCVQPETRTPVDLMSSDNYNSMWSNVMSLLGPWRMFVAFRITRNLIQTLLSALRATSWAEQLNTLSTNKRACYYLIAIQVQQIGSKRKRLVPVLSVCLSVGRLYQRSASELHLDTHGLKQEHFEDCLIVVRVAVVNLRTLIL